MDELNEELYSSILASILKYRMVGTQDDMDFVVELAKEATEGASEFLAELKEANSHLKETIKRLSSNVS